MTSYCFRGADAAQPNLQRPGLRCALLLWAPVLLAGCASTQLAPAPVAEATVRVVEAAPAAAPGSLAASPAGGPSPRTLTQPSLHAGEATARELRPGESQTGSANDADRAAPLVYGNDSRRDAGAAATAAPAVQDQTPITPLATPRAEPIHPGANRPYRVLNQSYIPETGPVRIKVRGIASWYGRPFHGQRTASGEIFDMYAMTAAHTTLALPSYARITHWASGRQVVVRINDRGPFKPNRMIDLSFSAARALGFVGQGMAEVELETISADEARAFLAQPPPASVQASLGGQNQSAGGAIYSASASPSASRASEPVAPVRPQLTRSNVEPLSIVAETPPGFFAQLGAFKDAQAARSFTERVMKLPDFEGAVSQVLNQGVLRVMLGPYADRAQAVAVGEVAGRNLGLRAFVHERK